MLPPRPESDDLPSGEGRRPADVWFPRGVDGNSEAWDFAVTSGMRADLVRTAGDNPDEIFVQYEGKKREHKQTAESCSAAGFRFCPLAFQAHAGGWSALVRAQLDWVARQAAASSGSQPGLHALKIAQRISTSLHRANARAVLKRAVVPEIVEAASGWVADPEAWV